ncbi:hypothetical protein AAKU55_002586 [Oxalobacteraceae bacterium GrIS 1.11]
MAPGDITTLREQSRPLLLGRALGIVAILALAGALLVWGIDLGRRIVGLSAGAPGARQQIALLQSELTRVALERDRVADAAAQTAMQIKALQFENSKLSEDLALVESRLAPPKAGLAILAMGADLLSRNQLHYVLLLNYGAKKGAPQFAGQLTVTLEGEKDGVSVLLEFPAQADAALYGVAVRDYQRLDGMLTVPDGVQVKTLRARLFENGVLLAQQSTTVKDHAYVRP